MAIVTVYVTKAPEASVGITFVSATLVPDELLLPVHEKLVIPAGIGFDTVTFVAAFGPKFVTPIVYVWVVPGTYTL